MKDKITKRRIGLIIAFAFFSLTCERPTEQKTDTPQLGKRDYTWNFDTLSYPNSSQTNMTSIYGTSASNVYVCGHNDQNRGFMFYYDGVGWSSVRLTTNEGGQIQKGMDLNAMHGSGVNNIWAVGYEGFWDEKNLRIVDSSLAIRYDSVQWKVSDIPVRGGELYCVWVLSTASVWAGGGEGLVFIGMELCGQNINWGNNFLLVLLLHYQITKCTLSVM